jgi:cell division protein FtsB
LRAGGEAIEEHARTVLGMVKDDERFYQVID